MPKPRPPHSIQLIIPHFLSEDQFDEIEDLTFLHFEAGGEDITHQQRYQSAWPISLKIVSTRNTSLHSLTLSQTPPLGQPSSPTTTTADVAEAVVEEKTSTGIAETIITISICREWDLKSEVRMREIVRGILLEMLVGEIEMKHMVVPPEEQ